MLQHKYVYLFMSGTWYIYTLQYMGTLKPSASVYITILGCWGTDSSVGKSSTSQAGDLGLNPSGGLIRVTKCMNER